ncbi:MAG: hypothetical protein ACOX8S_10295 [Christensenellales bacterium]|jgi:uncharacterized protein YoxC
MLEKMKKENYTKAREDYGGLSALEKWRLVSSLITAVASLLILLILAVAVISLAGTISKADAALSSLGETLAEVEESKGAILEAAEMAARLNSLSKELDEADIPGLVDDMRAFVADAQEIMQGLDEAATGTLRGSAETLEKLNSIDIDALNSTIKSFTSIVEPLARFFGR